MGGRAAAPPSEGVEVLMLKTFGSVVLVVALLSVGAVGCSSTTEDPATIAGPETAVEIPAGATQSKMAWPTWTQPTNATQTA